MFSIQFDTENAAFEGVDRDQEIIRILKVVIHKIGAGHEDGRVMDVNGNKVGEWSITQ